MFTGASVRSHWPGAVHPAIRPLRLEYDAPGASEHRNLAQVRICD